MAILIRKSVDHISNKSLTPFWEEVKKLDPNKRYKIFVTDTKDIRSRNQNRYYWGVVLREIARHTGHSEEEMHELFKAKFNLRTMDLPDGVCEFGGSTKIMTTTEFKNYLDKIIHWASEIIGVNIPSPDGIPNEIYVDFESRGAW